MMRDPTSKLTSCEVFGNDLSERRVLTQNFKDFTESSLDFTHLTAKTEITSKSGFNETPILKEEIPGIVFKLAEQSKENLEGISKNILPRGELK
jgi:hypothetical protein